MSNIKIKITKDFEAAANGIDIQFYKAGEIIEGARNARSTRNTRP